MYKPYFRALLFSLTALTFVSCDKDFNEIGADIVGDDHFDVLLKDDVTLIANTVATGPIETKNLDINPLGVYDDPSNPFGKTTASFATQLELPDNVPAFNAELLPEIESVILYVPYFSERTSTTSNGDGIYEVDSIYGDGITGRFNLKVYQSGYYMGDIGTGQEPQRYYSDQNADFNAVKIGSPLNNSTDTAENSEFYFSAAEIRENSTVDGETTTTRTAPGMRLQLDKTVFQDKIINAPAGMLASNNVFKNYFRGLYFRAEDAGAASSLGLLNFKAGTITIKYKEDKETCTDPDDETTCSISRVDKTMTLYMRGNTVSLLDYVYDADYLAGLGQLAGQNTNLFLKGGQGSVATIDLFGPDLTGNPVGNGPDGVPDELAELKALQEDESAAGWLINEANLTFTVNTDLMGNAPVPNRIYLYDIANKRPLVDYTYDGTTGTSLNYNKQIFGGILKEEADGRKTYKIRVTNYIRNLIKNDSTNVRLGLSITGNIGLTSMVKLRSENDALNDYAPTASAINPLGVILYGNHPSIAEENRLKLEIFYTKPD